MMLAQNSITKAEFSLQIFGTYMITAGLTFMFVPQVLLGILHMTAGDETWIRLAGVLAVIIGFNHQLMAKQNAVRFIQNSVWLRYMAAAFMVSLVVWGKAVLPLLVLAFIDIAGATWTLIALKKDQK